MGMNATLLGEMITFIIFVLVTMKYIWPPIVKALQDRQKKIADGLEAAERGKHSLELARKKTADMLRDVKNQSSQIVDQAGRRSNQIVDEAQIKARQEGQRIITSAKSEVELMARNAKDGLRKEVTQLALDTAAKILAKEVDRAKHDKMLDELIAGL
jgi:F-type H+-transporting ATPase subunit b